MSVDRKTGQVRERELRQALSRIRHGRSRTNATRVSIAAVAREAGVSAALIHNHYPDVAAAIRESMGQGERARRAATNQELKAAQARVQELNAEIKSLRADVAKLASINEVLIAENTSFKATTATHGAVLPLSRTSRRDVVLSAVSPRRPT